VLMFGAILSGAVFGDNLAPVSDTTIVSAVTQDADIGGVVASRFKYAVLAAAVALVLYVVAGTLRGGTSGAEEARMLFAEAANPRGLVHLLSMGIVIIAALRGRHIVEAISWGLLAAVVFNLALGLAAPSQMLQFRVSEGSWAAETFAAPVSPDGVEPMIMAVADSPSVTGSIPEGAAGFFTMSVLILLVLAGAQVMIRGGGFEALERWLIRTVARTVRGAEMTMVGSTALVNAAITINTAAEIAIAPYIGSIGRRFNINGYRRANILDANTSALGYIFPWSGGVLIGVATMRGLSGEPWFTQEMIVNPTTVFLWVFHGWALVVLFLFAAWTGFGREYITDRAAQRSTQI
ncbi:MAG: Na+/H+ antiporter NhaC family protein, partial [Phycisphaeraceae bacterium]